MARADGLYIVGVMSVVSWVLAHMQSCTYTFLVRVTVNWQLSALSDMLGGLSAQVFEVNNAVPHLVHNLSNTSRIHLIVDVAEAVLPQAEELDIGQVCFYREGRIVC